MWEIRGRKARALKRRARGQQTKTHFRGKTEKWTGRCVFGLHRHERIAFLQKAAKHGLGAVKQGRSAANQFVFANKLEKTPQSEMGGSVFGPHRRKRIALCGKFGGAGLGRLKVGLGPSKTKHFRETHVKMDGTNAYLDRTGISGSRVLQKTAKHGLGAAKQSRSAANQSILAKQTKKTFHKWMDGSVFGPHRRKRIVFLGKFGDARHGRLKKGLGCSTKTHFYEQM